MDRYGFVVFMGGGAQLRRHVTLAFIESQKFTQNNNCQV